MQHCCLQDSYKRKSKHFSLDNYIWFDPIIVGTQEKRPKRNALRICSPNPSDLLLLGMDLNCAKRLEHSNQFFSRDRFRHHQCPS